MGYNKNYLQLEFESGYFFIYSKEPKEGYEKKVSSKGNTSYRKYFKDGVKGELQSASIYEGKFGNDISLSLKDGEEIYYLGVSLADQKGNVDDTYAESLIKLLPSLQRGQVITVKGYNFKPEDSKYSKIGISISSEGVKLKPSLSNTYTKDGVEVKGDIPALVWKKDALGKNKPTAISQEAKNDYLLEALKTQTERLKWEKDGTSNETPATTPKEQTPVKTSKFTGQSEEINDDLPF